MTSPPLRHFTLVIGMLAAVFCVLLVCNDTRAGEQLPRLDSQDAIPSKETIADLLEQEPVSKETWPTWRQRYLDWYYDRLSRTYDMKDALHEFVQQSASDNHGELPANMRDDPVVWCLWSFALLNQEKLTAEIAIEAEIKSSRALELDPEFAPAYVGKAYAFVIQAMLLKGAPDNQASREELLVAAEEQNRLALKFDDRSYVTIVRGMAKMVEEDFAAAEKLFAEALNWYPNSESTAIGLATCIVSQPDYAGSRSEATAELVERFPDSATVRSRYALALFSDERFQEAAKQVQMIRDAEEDPVAMLGELVVDNIQQMANIMIPEYLSGMKAFKAEEYLEAERHFRRALAQDPDNAVYARAYGHTILFRLGGTDPGGESLIAIEPLVERFPEDGELQALYAVALGHRQQWRDGAAALDHSRDLGTDPAQIISAETVELIESNAKPTVFEWALWGSVGFVGVYAVIMLAMALTGTVLARFTKSRPSHVPDTVGDRIVLGPGETVLKGLYVTALLIGLLFFYLGIPFVAAGVLVVTLALIIGILMLPVISIWLLVVVGATGLALAGAVIRSIFATTGSGAFGLRKTRSECPRLFHTITDVAQRVGTVPIHDVYLGPGSAIGVRQEGRGPFGILGVKRRVLTLGMSTMHYLTVSELKAIFAHEYAHFSHQDTSYSRFIQQVTLSIEEALTRMAYGLGDWNYINPFYWFFYLYYRSYTMLSAGFSRSREYLADRMAVSLYGKTAFISGLMEMATDGQLFEATIHGNVQHLLAEGKAFVNMYESFRSYRDEQLSQQERKDMFQQMLKEEPSLFATHPTFRQRVEALADYPDTSQEEPEPASTLFENVKEIEEELTQFLTQSHAQWQAVQSHQAVEQSGGSELIVDHGDPESVLEAAGMLDSDGQWDEAISLYEHVLKNWPEEYGQYAENCIIGIREKLALSRGGEDEA